MVLYLVHGKFTMPPNANRDLKSEFIIESINHHIFDTNPANEDYDAFLPKDNVPILCMLGNVIGSVVQMDDGSKAFDLRVSNYIQGKTVDCVYRYAFSLYFLYTSLLMFSRRCRFPCTARWAKINVPIAGVVIAIVGRPHSMSGTNGTGMLIVTVEDIVYNPGSTHIVADSKEESSASPRRLQVRKRKRVAEESKGMLHMSIVHVIGP